MRNLKTPLEKAFHRAPHEKPYQHAELHYSYGMGTFLRRIQHEEEDLVFDFEKKQATVKWLASFVKTSSSSSTSGVVPPWKRHGADGARGGGGGSGEADVLCFVQVATLRFRWVQVAESVGMWKIYCLEEYLMHCKSIAIALVEFAIQIGSA